MVEDAKTAGEDRIGPIGICLSGGGYRAAAFHLGALSYLEHVDLASELSILSSVSGGTFTATRYTVSQVAGEAFCDFFDRFYSFLEEADLVKLGLEHLAKGAADVPSGRQDLIVSAAEIYARTFLAKEDGNPWLFGDVLEALKEQRITLDEVVFNTTEFRHGIDFRFQSSGLVGNGHVSIPRRIAKQVRLADITAMSSCFPGGFEPVAFPFDVHWPGNRVPADIGEAFFTPDGAPRPLPVMDGGIYDNQGLEALMMADERAGDVLETIIISDVDQTDPDLYAFPDLEQPTGPTLDTAVWFAYALGLLSLLTFGVTASRLVTDLWQGAGLLDVLTGATGAVLSAATLVALWWLRGQAQKALRRLPQVGIHAWRDLRRLKVDLLAQMLYLRAGSLLALTSNVFLERIRGLILRRYYGDPEVRPKLVANFIYLLTLPRERRRLQRIPGVEVPAPGSELGRVTRAAESMATTLWFVKGRGWCQPSLVASGQATLVYALLLNLYQRHDGAPERGEALRLWQRLLEDMRKFLDEPYWLLKEMRAGDYAKPPADCSCADALAPAEEAAASHLL